MFRKISLCFFFLLVANFGFAQEIKYTNANDDWNADSLGNHRAVVSYYGNSSVAHSIVKWRRNDLNPWNKRIIVADAKTRHKVQNVKVGICNNEQVELWFEPTTGKGDYYVYYMPSKNEGRSNYPKGTYLLPEFTASASWSKLLEVSTQVNTVVKEIQAINAFNSFYPMEVVATVQETAGLIFRSKRSDYLVFPEDRLNPIKMTDHLPYRWVQKGPQNSFSGTAAKGEFFAFQLGIFALQDLEDLSVDFGDLKNISGAILTAKQLTCFNAGGVNYLGLPFVKEVDISKNKIQALWCGINVPQQIPAGIYTGTLVVKSKNAAATTVTIRLTVGNDILQNGGISTPWKQTRLPWLNSTLAQENTVIAPYTPLEVNERVIQLLGRRLSLKADGFPQQIETFFSKEMTGLQTQPNPILSYPIQLQVKGADSKPLIWTNSGIEFVQKNAGTVRWKATNTNADLLMNVDATLEFDGFCAYSVKITALNDVALEDIALDIPFTKAASTYMMGLGLKGGNRPDSLRWKWEVATKNQDGAWVGGVNAGLQFSLRDEKYVRPLNTNFYLQKPLLLPTSWGNNQKGGVTITTSDQTTILQCYSGERKMKKGAVLYYNFTLLITPFHPIQTDFQFANRFYHKYEKLDTIKASGASIVNIHHANALNPWINYPFIEHQKMKAYIDTAHSIGLKVKIYNTVRELSNHAYEIFPMRSLGHEIYSSGKGGGNSWLQEHVGSDYIAAWYVPEIKDAAIVNSGMSRWHNYYVEGMNWLTQKVGIDGIYLDDVAFDRITMKRIKRVLTQDGHPGIIDLHSANQYNKNDGFNNSANLYMEHFPYLNRLWFGEYFDYQANGPDFFLTEISGIPFGLMGEMLQDGGNHWRGMLYGMTNRYPWSAEADPRPLWKFWDDFGMQGTEMIGYWSDRCPVKTNHPNVLATVYQKQGATLISIASWADDRTDVQLSIDWAKLGLDPTKATITAKPIDHFQAQRQFTVNEAIPVEKGKGWLLVVR